MPPLSTYGGGKLNFDTPCELQVWVSPSESSSEYNRINDTEKLIVLSPPSTGVKGRVIERK